MPWSPQLTTLRNRLAVLFAAQEDARRVVEEAQLDPAHIAFDNKAINNWHNILSQAELRGKVEAIVLVAISQYGNDANLVAAYQAYKASVGRPAMLPPTQSQLVNSAVTAQPTSLDRPIRILFLAANPRDMDQLKLDEEVRSIDQALRRAALRDQFELVPHWAVRYSDLQELLLRHQPDIVHFSGHGAEGDEIVLVNDNGESHKVSGKALAMLFSTLRDNVRCVVFNACFSRPEAELIAQYIEVVIGMSNVISDESAINFASAFYQGLAYGRSFKTAFDLGCVQLGLANLPEHDTPQIVALRGDPAQITLARPTVDKSTDAQATLSKYNVTINNPQGLVIGDNAQVTQSFGTQINTGGGTHVGGDVNTGGDFVGRDKNVM